MPEPSETIAAECRALTHALLCRDPSPEVARRYAAANRKLFGEHAPRSAALSFARRHPWSAGLLDAACGWRRPDDTLRRKMLILSAVLETTTTHANHFLPAHRGLPAMFALLFWNGAKGVAKALAGAMLLPVADRAARRR